jgi:hypothetical protein
MPRFLGYPVQKSVDACAESRVLHEAHRQSKHERGEQQPSPYGFRMHEQPKHYSDRHRIEKDNKGSHSRAAMLMDLGMNKGLSVTEGLTIVLA